MKTTSLNLSRAALATMLSTLIGCSTLTEKETLISGIVYDQSTGLPVEGIDIDLRAEWESIEPFGPVYGELIATTTTHSNGSFSFDIKLSSRPRYSYKIQLNTEGLPYAHQHWQDGNYLASTLEAIVEAGRAQHVNMPVVSIGELDIVATNNHPTDSLLFELTSSINGYVRTCYYRLLGPSESYNLDIYDWLPQGNVDLTWKITGSNIDSTINFQRTIVAGINEINFTFEG